MADPLASDSDTALASGQAQATQKPPPSREIDTIPEDVANKMLQRGEEVNKRLDKYATEEAEAAKNLKPPPSVEGGQLSKVPPAPQHDIRENAVAWLGFATALGGIAGAMTKRSSMNALAAFSGTLDGLMTGDQKKFDDNFKTWEAEAKRTQENNKTELDGYRNIMDRADLDHKQRADQLLIWATQNRNGYFIELAKLAKERGDFDLLAASVDSISAFGEKGTDAAAKIIETREQRRAAQQERLEYARQLREEKTTEARGMVRDLLEDVRAGRQSPMQTGIYGQNRLIMDQEARKMGIALGDYQLKWRTAENLNRSLSSVQRANMYAYGDRFVKQTVPRLNALAEKLNLDSAPLLNWGQLQILANETGPRSQIAAQYVAEMRIAQEDVAQLAKGGYSPTNQYLDFAQKAIDENMSVKNLQAALEEEQRGVGFTINAFGAQGAGVIGPTATNPFLGGKPPIDISESGRVSNYPPPPKEAIDDLRANPGTRAQFDEAFGPGAAAKILGGQ